MLCCYFKIFLCTPLFTISSVIKNSVFLFTGLQLDKDYLLPVAELNLTLTPYPKAKVGPAAPYACIRVCSSLLPEGLS